MPWFCYECMTPRSLCIPGPTEGSCARVEAASAAYQAEKAAGGKRVFLASVPGGTTEVAGLMDHTRQFHKDMYAYENAVRAGENPDGTTAKAVERTRKRVESFERLERKGYLERA